MTIEEFEKLTDELYTHCKSLMIGPKHKEYSRNNDKLHNFKVAAAMSLCTPEKALWGMMMKHVVSIRDMIEYGEWPSDYKVREKIGDTINYLFLLYAIFREKSASLENNPVRSDKL